MDRRIEQIMDLLHKKGSVWADELVELLGVSLVTIRRTLKELEEQGKIVRFRGGAMLPSEPNYGHEPTLIEREVMFQAEKKAIAKKAAESVLQGEIIVIDIGTTGIELAHALRGRNNITVFTASIPVATILMNTNVSVFLFGGLVKGKEKSIGGSIARMVISNYSFDKYFLTAGGLSSKFGVTDFGMDEVEVKQAIIERTRNVICLADSSKFEKNVFIKICDLDQINKVIVDQSIDGQIKNTIIESGVNLVVAD